MTVCATGHRPHKLGGYENWELFTRIEIKIFSFLLQYYNEGHRSFISGGALGMDQFFARAVIVLKKHIKDNNAQIPELIMARPFPGQASKWPATSQAVFNWLCGQADRVVDVNPDPYAPWKMQARNVWMVDESSRVLALYDNGGGGTKNCIDYAVSQGKMVDVIHPFDIDNPYVITP